MRPVGLNGYVHEIGPVCDALHETPSKATELLEIFIQLFAMKEGYVDLLVIGFLRTHGHQIMLKHTTGACI